MLPSCTRSATRSSGTTCAPGAPRTPSYSARALFRSPPPSLIQLCYHPSPLGQPGWGGGGLRNPARALERGLRRSEPQVREYPRVAGVGVGHILGKGKLEPRAACVHACKGAPREMKRVRGRMPGRHESSLDPASGPRTARATRLPAPPALPAPLAADARRGAPAAEGVARRLEARLDRLGVLAPRGRRVAPRLSHFMQARRPVRLRCRGGGGDGRFRGGPARSVRSGRTGRDPPLTHSTPRSVPELTAKSRCGT